MTVTHFGPIIRASEVAVKDKSYRRSAIGQEVGRFLRALRWSGHSPATLDAYELTLAKLAIEHDDFDSVGRFCSPDGTELLRDFLERNWGEAKPATKRRHLAAVKSFLAWELAERRIEWNPAASIRAPRLRSGGEERIAYAVPTLLQLVRSQPALRDQCALQLLCRMALRKNELRLLRIRDIDLVRNLLVVHGKGGTTVVMPLEFVSLRDDLYLHVQGDERAPDEYLLYARERRTSPMDASSVHRWFKACLDRAGLPATIKPHEMRHSAADHLWRGTGNLVMAQQLLRHASVQTTQRYLHPTRRDLADAMHRLEEDWS